MHLQGTNWTYPVVRGKENACARVCIGRNKSKCEEVNACVCKAGSVAKALASFVSLFICLVMALIRSGRDMVYGFLSITATCVCIHVSYSSFTWWLIQKEHEWRDEKKEKKGEHRSTQHTHTFSAPFSSILHFQLPSLVGHSCLLSYAWGIEWKASNCAQLYSYVLHVCRCDAQQDFESASITVSVLAAFTKGQTKIETTANEL